MWPRDLPSVQSQRDPRHAVVTRCETKVTPILLSLLSTQAYLSNCCCGCLCCWSGQLYQRQTCTMPMALVSMPGQASITNNHADHLNMVCLRYIKEKRTQISLIRPHSSIESALRHSQHQTHMAHTAIKWQIHLLNFLHHLNY